MSSNIKAAVLLLAVLLVKDARADAASPTARGEYLVTVAACRGCHTPKDAGASPFSGGTRFGGGPSAVAAANITPDVETGIGSWSSQQIIAAIRQGVRPDGTRIRPPMPQAAYRLMSDQDAEAIAIFLKSVPPVHHDVSRTAALGPSREPDQPVFADSSHMATDEPVARGRYIVTALTHCTECHERRSDPAPDAVQHSGETAHVFRGPWGIVAAPNIAPAALMRFSDAELGTILIKGVRPDGSTLVGPMPVTAYAGLTSEDLTAVIAYLRSSAR